MTRTSLLLGISAIFSVSYSESIDAIDIDTIPLIIQRLLQSYLERVNAPTLHGPVQLDEVTSGLIQADAV